MTAFYLWLFCITGGLLIVSFVLHPFFSGIDRVFHGVHGGLGAIDGGHSVHLGGAHVDGHAGGSHGAGHGGEDAVSPLNSRSLLAFLTFFGGTGYLARAFGLPGVLAFIVAAVAGWLSAWLVWKLLVFVVAQAASSTIARDEPVGREGRVTVAIRPGSAGKVLLDIRGESLAIVARAADAQSIATGATVLVARSGADGIYVVQPSPSSSEAAAPARQKRE
jgi:membrane protein implicated in regulation of membrane protease activity